MIRIQADPGSETLSECKRQGSRTTLFRAIDQILFEYFEERYSFNYYKMKS